MISEEPTAPNAIGSSTNVQGLIESAHKRNRPKGYRHIPQKQDQRKKELRHPFASRKQKPLRENAANSKGTVAVHQPGFGQGKEPIY